MVAIAALFMSAIAIALVGAFATHARRLETELRLVREELAAQRAYGPTPWMSPAPDWLRLRDDDATASAAVAPTPRVSALAETDNTPQRPASRTWPLDPDLRPTALFPRPFIVEQPLPVDGSTREVQEPWQPTPPSAPSILKTPPAIPNAPHLHRQLWLKALAAATLIAGLCIGAIALPALSHPLVLTLLAIGLLATLAARLEVEPRGHFTTVGLITSASATIALVVLAYVYGPMTWSGLGLALITTCAAVVGASRGRLEPMLIGAWLATCAGLWVLSGEPAASIWLTPAAAISGALFLALAAAQPHRLSPKGVVLASIAACAPLFCVYLLSGEGQPLANDPLASGAAFASVAVLLGLLIAAAARAQGELHAMGLSAWVLCLGSLVAAMAAAALAAPAIATGPLWGALAAGLAWRVRQDPHPVFATLSGAVSLAAAITAAITLYDAGASLTAGLAVAATAWVLAAASRFPAPRLGAVLEAPALAMAVLASIALITPSVFVGEIPSFTALGLLAITALTGGLALRFGAPRANSALREIFAWTLITLAMVALALSLGFPQNPWWGTRPESTTPWALIATAFVPAALLAMHAGLSLRRADHIMSVAMGSLTGLTAAAGMVMTLRLAFHGGTWGQGLAPFELFASSATILAAGGLLLAFGWRRAPQSALRWAGTTLIALAFLKLIALDMVMAHWLPASVAAGVCLAGLAAAIFYRAPLIAYLRQG